MRKPKDTNAPKRPLSSFFLFMGDNRQKVKEEKPDLKMTEIAKEISNRWKEIDADLKKEYENKAKCLKEEYIKQLNKYMKTAQYLQFQQKLKQWKEEQNDANVSNDNSNSTYTNPNKKTQKKQSKPATKINKSEITAKIGSFFERYRERLRKSKWPPSEAVSDQYGCGIENGSEWIANQFSNKELNINEAIYAFYRLAIFKANIGMMDFSCGGPFPEIGEFMGKVNSLIEKYDADQFDKKMVKQFYKGLCKYHQTWDAYALGRDIKETVDKIKQKWSF
eukprot:22395_1